MSKPCLAIALGDPLSIGPEILLKSLLNPLATDNARILVLGHLAVLEREAQRHQLPVRFRRVENATQARYEAGVFDLLEPEGMDAQAQSTLAALPMGKIDALAGKASVLYVEQAARLALEAQVDAVVTGPINKESVQLAGYTSYIGNTEILEQVARAHTGKDYRGLCLTMLISKGLRVAHVTRHVAFRDIAARLTPALLEQTLRLTHLGMVSLGFDQARIALAGLNPHNGDGGLMGDEEARLLVPAVAKAQAQGLRVVGPEPADTVFHKAISGAYDAVVALYHDQGHIAVKTHGFEESISVSFGLPIIRTSVDHGTAFDIAGQGLALPTSLVEAIRMAKHIVGVNRWQVAE